MSSESQELKYVNKARLAYIFILILVGITFGAIGSYFDQQFGKIANKIAGLAGLILSCYALVMIVSMKGYKFFMTAEKQELSFKNIVKESLYSVWILVGGLIIFFMIMIGRVIGN